jgi:hypothetical protein
VPPLNHLAGEASPYLLQHAANPVDWWPWGDGAFAEARRRDVPVLISVGYSACHWCHVMAHESFEDNEVAAALNSDFLPVKVDREERPDVDAVYMEAVQMMSGSGGWPMTVLATADGRPFWAGTYLPKNNFLSLLRQVTDLWATRRDALESDADRLAEAVRHGAELLSHLGEAQGTDYSVADAGAPDEAATDAPGTGRRYGARGYGSGPAALALAAEGILARRDPDWGGAAGAPKFPQPATLEVLARRWWRSGDTEALGALRRALDAMSSGGIYDHLAGGFARYSTDRRWLVPHFEKMLYDNALLVRAYTHAWQLTGDARYRQVVEETVGYLLSPPLRLTEGAWASAEDADSEGEEGRFYTWSRAEVDEVAGSEVAEWYGATAPGNWEGKNILWRAGRGDIQRPSLVEQGRRLLLERRSQRARPGLDGKVLTEWNAMAIAALAGAGTAFDQPAWVGAASQTAELLLLRLRRPDGRWLRSWRPGPPGGGDGPPARHLAYAGDYAWLVAAFTALGEATGASSWTGAAREVAAGLADLFWDRDGGGFFTSGHDGEQLIARLKDFYDGAVPSANAVAAGALARLGELTGEDGYMDMALETVRVMQGALGRAPAAFPGTALVADYLSEPRRQVVVASSDPALVRPVWERYLPDTVLAWGEPYPSPLWEGRSGPDSTGLAFVCEGFACKLPVRGADALADLIQPRPR